MELTQDDQAKIRNWLTSHAFGGIRCSVCGQQNWTIMNVAAMTGSIDLNTSRINHLSGFPMIGITCNNCAHIEWFSAPAMGFKPKTPEENPPAPKSKK